MAEDKIWEEVLKYAKNYLSQQIIETWLKPLSIKDLRGDIITISAPNRFYKNWVEDKYLEILKKIFKEELTIDTELTIEVDNEQKGNTNNNDDKLAYTSHLSPTYFQFSTNLNKQYTFENFVVGSSNEFAFSAASAVAEGYFHTYNPLFIYGGVGLGKTHIMHAIGNKLVKSFPKLKVLYISSESFTNEMIYSIKSKAMDSFREKYRNIDVLLFDDVQFLAGKTRSTEEFFYTFNSLYDDQKQIIITSDKTPDEIPEMEERLTSRFAWGLIADIQPPNVEERTAILLKRAEIMGIDLSREIALFIAENLKGDNVRELIGALIRLSAYASFNNESLTIEFTKKCLDKFLIKKDRFITTEVVIDTICEYFNVKLAELKSKKRTKSVSLPRQIAMYLLREKLNISLQEIGDIFGGRDHSTVLYSLTSLESKLKVDQELRSIIEHINKKLYK